MIPLKFQHSIEHSLFDFIYILLFSLTISIVSLSSLFLSSVFPLGLLPREGPGVVENVHLRIPSVIVKGD